MADRRFNGGERRFVVRRKDQVVDAASEIGQHEALALGGGQDQVDGLLDTTLVGRAGEPATGRNLRRKFPTGAESRAIVDACHELAHRDDALLDGGQSAPAHAGHIEVMDGRCQATVR